MNDKDGIDFKQIVSRVWKIIANVLKVYFFVNSTFCVAHNACSLLKYFFVDFCPGVEPEQLLYTQIQIVLLSLP